MVKICVLCGTKFEGHGNNPAPLNRGHGRCCDKCNTDVVIPKRMDDMLYQMFKKIMSEQEKYMLLSGSLNK
jgi:hypothetical protein